MLLLVGGLTMATHAQPAAGLAVIVLGAMSGLFLARLLLGDDLRTAFEFCAAAVHEVLLETQACGSYELELVRAQDRIAHPRVKFEAVKLG